MLKKFLLIPLFLLLAYGIFSSTDFKVISSGIAIFIVGMFFMEDGFKLFTGGFLEKILEKSTKTIFKAIFSGFFATAVVQSSSLVSVIAISFLSAELIALSQAIGIIFGANIGTTATAWIVSAFGVKIKISMYAMPMLVFGVVFTFFKDRSFKGLGNILLGLGFIFLGISYMKDGFETLKMGIDIGRFAMEGYLGIAVYVMVGTVATVIIQSSSATMALIITAVASGQIDYVNSIALAIGANIGTTVTAILGALTSNANGKRLAVAHLIFNFITALFAIVCINILIDIVDYLSVYMGIGEEDIAMKLSLFHTIFNVCGVFLVTPFLGILVTYLEKLFIYKGERRGIPKFLDLDVIKYPGPALVALTKETEHLYDSISHVIVKALRLHRHDVWSNKELRAVVDIVKGDPVDVDKVYMQQIKFLYADIIRFATLAEKHMIKEEREKVYSLKLACRNMIESVKDIRELQKNISKYMRGNNSDIEEEYNFLRKNIASILRDIDNIRKDMHNIETITKIETAKEQSKSFDIIETKRLSILLREEKIDDIMATSLMNDGVFTGSISKKLLEVASILWVGGGLLESSEDLGKRESESRVIA
jgi:phosphate:Na+ symporter